MALAGKRCIIVGGTDPLSIGGACVGAFLAAEAEKIVVFGRDPTKLPASLSLKDVHPMKVDLKKPETMKEALDEAVRLLGGTLDVLVISAANGYSEYLGLDPDDAASYRMMHDVAVLSPLFLINAAAPYLSKAEGGGAVVVVSSLAARVPWPDTAPFNLAKAAQNCLVETLAFKHRQDNIRVNAVLPACIHTEALNVMAAKKNRPIEEYAALRAESHPMGRNGTPHEVASAVLFLASSASAFITGTLLPVDGGLSLSSWFNKPKLLAEYVGGTKAST